MSDRSGITVDAWLTELSKLTAKGKDAKGFTVQDVVDNTGKSETWVRGMMRKAFRAGLVESVGQREGCRIDGVPCWIPVYRVTPGVAGGKKR